MTNTTTIAKDVSAVKAFATSLLSRKFVAAVGVIVPALIAKRWDVAVTALLGYLGVEGAADVVTRVKASGTGSGTEPQISPPIA